MPCDLNETTMYRALSELRPMAHARGYNDREIQFDDVILVCSDYNQQRADELKLKHPGLRIQIVTPALLKTPFSWAVVFGKDAFISMPPW